MFVKDFTLWNILPLAGIKSENFKMTIIKFDIKKMLWKILPIVITGLILKISSVWTMNNTAEILIFCHSEWNFVSQIFQTDTSTLNLTSLH